jgi:hypothetical protein
MEKMMNTAAAANAIVNTIANRYVLLHDNVAYDNDDYNVWGAILYDCEEKKITIRHYGHGVDLDRTNVVELDEALTNGIVTINEIKEYIVQDFDFSFKRINLCDLACDFSQSNPMSIPVTIVRGRKGKGKKGSLIYGQRKRNYYGWGQYHEVYDEFAYVLLNDSNEVIKVNSFDYLQVDEEFISRYNQAVKSKVLSQVELRKLSWLYAYGMSYASCDKRNLHSSLDTYSRLADSLYKATESVINAISAYQAECDRIAKEKREALKKEVMPQLIEWVLNNTDKQGDDVEKLALHIFNKRY